MTVPGQQRYPVYAAALCVLLVSPAAWGEAPLPEGKSPVPEGEAPLLESEVPLPEPEAPLFEQDPYDVITLDEHNENAVLQVRPLDFPDRRVPDPFPKRGRLQVRKREEPETLYEIEWPSIARIELFEELVLKEAKELVQERRLGEAYNYFNFLLHKDPNLPGLDRAVDDYFFAEAGAFLSQGQYEDALAMLRELHGRDPNREGLGDRLGQATENLVQKYVNNDDYWAARQLLGNLADLSPGHAIVKKWEARLQQQAASLLTEGRQAARSGELREAHRLGRELMHVWPRSPEGRAFMDAIQEQYPRVEVGVSLPAAVIQPGRLHDWASRRSSRLIWRTLTEFVGRDVEGGKYHCPLGEMKTGELRYDLLFQLGPDVPRSAGAEALTGYDLARQLLAMADPSDPAYRLDWAELLDWVSVRDVYTVTARLHRPHVRPEALLRTAVAGYAGPADSDGSDAGNGPYTVASRFENEIVYLANPQYSAAGPRQPKELVERCYPKGIEAVQALQRRQIDVLDRVNPWDLEKVRSISGVVVERYTVPLVHCLVPNPRKPLTARRTFRGALVYGIHREAILKHLLRLPPGEELPPGCQVLSGPLSPGISTDDPLDYAYDHNIEPRAYQPRQAIALAQATLLDVAAAQKKQGIELKTMPALVLAHPPHEIARVACTSIKRQLKLVRIPVTLRELPPGIPARIPDDVDLLYAELAVWEPIVDARWVLDEGGIAGGSSPHMSLALRQLDEATDWGQVGARLRSVHWLAHTEISIVPLWQLTDHFAYQRSLKGVGTELVSLYQEIERWQPATKYTAVRE